MNEFEQRRADHLAKWPITDKQIREVIKVLQVLRERDCLIRDLSSQEDEAIQATQKALGNYGYHLK